MTTPEPSKWATERARTEIAPSALEPGSIVIARPGKHGVRLGGDGSVEFLRGWFAQALDAARAEGAREEREACARIARDTARCHWSVSQPDRMHASYVVEERIRARSAAGEECAGSPGRGDGGPATDSKAREERRPLPLEDRADSTVGTDHHDHGERRPVDVERRDGGAS